MTTIGYATLQIIPSLKGVSEAIEQQVAGKAVNVTIEPKVSQPAAERAGKQAKETVEKHTTQVKVEPKVDQKAAEDAGKKTGDAVAKGASASTTAIGGAIVGALQGAGEEAGRRLGERLRDAIPTGLTGAAERIGTALRNSLPTLGASAGTALGTAIGVGLTNAIGKERLDAAGRAILTGLTRAVNAANTGTDIGVAIGAKVAGGLTSASDVIGGVAGRLTETIGGIGTGIDAAKQIIGSDSWAAPGLDAFNNALGVATPLLGAMTGAASLASAGAQAISTAVGLASKAQLLWNAALVANPIGLIVTAIAAVVAGLVLFFTKTELGRKIWEGFTQYLKIAWEAIKLAFGAAWDVIKGIWDAMVAGASAVWDGIKSRFTAVVDFVKGLPGMIAGAARGMWDGISNAFKSMIDRIKGWWNSFADALSFTVPDITGLPGRGETFRPIPKLSSGGYTGDMATSQVAGVVHGGEYVIKASSTSSIQNAFPGLLDYLNNKGALPGYYKGGQVQLGNISGPGITTAEQQSMWDAVRGKFPNAILTSATRTVMTEGHADYHNAGRAIDISGPGMGAIASWIASNYPDSLELIHSPFGNNIKNGKNVGDGTSFYGAGLMAAHRDHVHWALGKSAKAAAASTDMLPVLGLGDAASSTATPAAPAMSPAVTAESQAANSAGATQTAMSMPSSLSGLSSFGFSDLGKDVGKTSAGTDLSIFSQAAGSAVEGQVGSALGAFGVNDSPGWLKGLSTFVSGINVGGGDGASAAPLSAATSAVPAASSALSGVVNGGQQQPGPVTNFNIQTTDIEPAYLVSQRIEKERAAARLARF